MRNEGKIDDISYTQYTCHRIKCLPRSFSGKYVYATDTNMYSLVTFTLNENGRFFRHTIDSCKSRKHKPKRRSKISRKKNKTNVNSLLAKKDDDNT